MKSIAISDFQQQYAELKTAWGGFAGYDPWVARANNASFGAQAAYDELVPGFEARFEREERDWPRFYDAVKALRRRPISGPFIVTMNSSPDLAARFAHVGHYFHARGQADESIVALRVRGFIALIGARALDGPYEWAAWVNWAIEAGVPRETADAIRELSGLAHPAPAPIPLPSAPVPQP